MNFFEICHTCDNYCPQLYQLEKEMAVLHSFKLEVIFSLGLSKWMENVEGV